MKNRTLPSLLLILFVAPNSFASEPGEKLYKAHCAACHSLQPPPKQAPPFRGIIRHYYERHSEKETFISAIKTFVLNPESAEVVCTPAKERFGAMPKISVSEEEVETIATWMWENKSLWPPRFR